MFTVPVTFDAATRRRDKSVSMRFTSNLEITPEDLMELDRQIHNEGWLAFDDNAVSAAASLPMEDAPSRHGASLSRRLRQAICAVYYKKNGTWDGSEEFYSRNMERLILGYEELSNG